MCSVDDFSFAIHFSMLIEVCFSFWFKYESKRARDEKKAHKQETINIESN